MTTYADIGSLSHGTMLASDLIPTFLGELDRLMEARSLSDDADADGHGRYDDWAGKIERTMYAHSSEEVDWILDELFDRLDAFAPPYCYFGSHEGDGADYGFWPILDAVQDAVRDGTLLDVSEAGGPPDETDDGFDGYVVMSDHGNVELYDADGANLWGIV